LLFGIASFRAQVLPRGAVVVLIVGALVGFPSPLYPPKLVVLALAVGCMGYWMWRLNRRSLIGQPSRAA
jgi:hypothetical protein